MGAAASALKKEIPPTAPREERAAVPSTGAFWPIVLLITLVGTIARYLHVQSITGGNFERLLYPDEVNYYVAGAEMIRDQGLAYFNTPRSLWNAPLYPAIIASLGVNITAVKWMNIIAISLSSLLSADFARRIAGRNAGLLAAFFCATYYPFYVFGGTVLSEPLFTLFVTMSLWLLAWRPQLAVIAGVVMGFAALVRPTVQYAPLLCFLGAFVVRDRSVRRALIGFGVGLLLLVGPIIARNYALFKVPSISTGSGAVLYLGNDLRRDGNEPLYSFMDFDTSLHTAPYTHLDKEGDALLTAKAVERIKEHPFASAWLFTRKVIRFAIGDFRAYFFPYDEVATYLMHQSRREGLRLEYEIILRTVFAIGALFALFSLPLSPAVRLVGGGVVGYMILVHAALFPIPRMFLPLIPFTAALAAAYLMSRQALWKPLMFIVTGLCVLVVNFYGVFWDLRDASPAFAEYFQTELRLTVDENDSPTKSEGVERKDTELVISADTAFVEFEVPEFTGAGNAAFFVVMTTSTPDSNPNRWGAGQIAWGREKGFAPSHVRDFPVFYDGREHTYMIPLGLATEWRTSISAIRLYLPRGAIGARVKIKEIRLAR